MDGVIVREPAAPPAHRSGHEERGAVLAFVILLMLAMLVLAHGALLASLSELAASRAAVRELELQGAARWALAATLSAPVEPWVDSLAIWDLHAEDLGPIGDVDARGELWRLGAESWLARGAARNAHGAEASTAYLAWALDPVARVTTLAAALSVGPTATVTLGGVVDVTAPTAVRDPASPSSCDPWLVELGQRYATAPLAPVGPLPDSAAVPTLGLLNFTSLLDLAPVMVSGTGTPSPTESFGACLVDAPWGWGDPDAPSEPCGGHLPMRGASGDLTVDGGGGQGLLVVEGDLTVRNGARFYGMAVVGGSLALEGGAQLEGMVLAGGGASVDAGATLTGSACWAARALTARRDILGRLVPVVSVGAIGPD